MTAASAALPSHARSSPAGQLDSPPGFNQYTRDYAAFCALPPDKRVFYKVADGKIVETKLDESNWQQPVWNYSPAPSQMAGGMWDDVVL